MGRKVLATIMAVFAIECGATLAYGWNDFGHMTVAYVAYQRLTPATRQRASALLQLNPRYNDWLTMVPANTPTADKELMLFMIAATWPDQIKRPGSGYQSDGSDNGDRPEGSPSPNRNTGYDDKLMHKYWHFVDTPFSDDGTRLPAVPTPNAQTQIGVFRGVLASSSGDQLKSYDLTWLLHLVGDIHQPLHCATRVSNAEPSGDSGGNKVGLNCTGCGRELHAFWDNVLGTSDSPTAVIEFAGKLPVADGTLAAKVDEKDWIAESFDDAVHKVYVPPISAGDGPFVLTDNYKTAAETLAEQRVALAGARLANLLNKELK